MQLGLVGERSFIKWNLIKREFLDQYPIILITWHENVDLIIK